MIRSPSLFLTLWVGARPMHDGSVNVKFYANPIVEYISRRICCQRFYDAPRLRDRDRTATWWLCGWPQGLRFGEAAEVVDQRLSDPGGSGNRMISDMQVINFLTRVELDYQGVRIVGPAQAGSLCY
jgi:hypothetical protein